MFKAYGREIKLLRELYATPTRYYHTFGHAMPGADGVDIEWFNHRTGVWEFIVDPTWWGDEYRIRECF